MLTIDTDSVIELARPRISSFSLIIVFVLLTLIGLSFIPFLNIQLNSSKRSPAFSISYYWHDASAKTIEQEVTNKLEGFFSLVKGLEGISSISSKGYGRINLSFKNSINVDAARFEIAALIRQNYHELPEGISYPQISLNALGQASTPLLSYTISGKVDARELTRYAQEILSKKIAAIKGVNDIKIYGYTPSEWNIEFSRNKTRLLGINSTDISTSVNAYFNQVLIGKGFERSLLNSFVNERTLILEIDKPDSLKWYDIPIKLAGKNLIRLGDIAKIRYLEQTPTAFYRVNGVNAINFLIYPGSAENTITLAAGIKSIIDGEVNNSPYNITLVSDNSELLAHEIRKIALRGLLALCSLLVFVYLINRKVKYLILVSLGVLVSLSISLIFIRLFNVELNLYSLCGFIISLSLIIDNNIIMTDHYHNFKNKKVFLAILVCSLSTIAALSIVFLLNEEQKYNLMDFVKIICIELFVSLFVSLMFIPALYEAMKIDYGKRKYYLFSLRKTVAFNAIYKKYIGFGKKYKWILFGIALFSFGIPVHLLPNKIKSDSEWSRVYNSIFTNTLFTETIRPIIEKSVGGSLRLFSKTFEKSFYSNQNNTTLFVKGKMPEGCTIQQMNEAIQEFEIYIKKFNEVKNFQTSILGYKNSLISISFKPEYEAGNFPYIMKSALEEKAISLGGVDWSIYGVGEGFSNALHNEMKNSTVLLEGYNYDQLYVYAQILKSNLLQNPRIKEVDIVGSETQDNQVSHEYFIDFDRTKLAQYNLSPFIFYSFLKDRSLRSPLNSFFYNNELQYLSLTSDTYNKFNVWDLNNEPISLNNKTFKLNQFGKIEKKKISNDIYKINQQYQLAVIYDFIGPDRLSEIIMNENIDALSKLLPLGYRAFSRQQTGWNKGKRDDYYLLCIILIIIYFICSILFESLLQPLAIIATIPISFIGLFTTFYLFDINFDQGGYAAMVMLCGVSVSSGVYIINDYNNIIKETYYKNHIDIYIKALNYKIRPILLSIIASIIALIPFLYEGQNEVFWFALAAGLIGGLLFSLIALFFYLPLFLISK